MNLNLNLKLLCFSISVIVFSFFNCAGKSIEKINDNTDINDLTNKSIEYWNQRTNPDALKKAEILISQIIEKQPGNFESSILLGKIKYIQGYFFENNLEERKILFSEGSEICKNAVLTHPDFYNMFPNFDKNNTDQLLDVLNKAPKSTLPGLYWWGQNLILYLNDKPVIERLNNRELMEQIMHRVVALDPGYDFSGPFRFFGILYSRIPGLDLSKSNTYFGKAIKANPQFLGNKLMFAEFYHQKAGNKEKFNYILNEILNRNLTKHPELMAENFLIQKKAQTLLDNESSLFE
ncbi:MAG: hypothetical protein CMG60_03960 [Candidatus Marinimicrobia bacterium]|nr:hypothetical protein [Candidatus Neomarinimicrobiota bacterium]